jgi:pyruvate/2-oxoglutarate dehydrogenase complex dihydrolipoamide dehydrogenase (E3) component
VTDNNKTGIAKILLDNGRIVGAHIVAPHAGELIHELALAIQEKMKISKITSLVHAYPSYSQLNKRLAGQYYKDRLFSPMTIKIVKLLNRIF